jgi:hypothetical protein
MEGQHVQLIAGTVALAGYKTRAIAARFSCGNRVVGAVSARILSLRDHILPVSLLAKRVSSLQLGGVYLDDSGSALGLSHSSVCELHNNVSDIFSRALVMQIFHSSEVEHRVANPLALPLIFLSVFPLSLGMTTRYASERCIWICGNSEAAVEYALRSG